MEELKKLAYAELDKRISSAVSQIAKLDSDLKALREAKTQKIVEETTPQIVDDGIDFSLEDFQEFLALKRNKLEDKKVKSQKKLRSKKISPQENVAEKNDVVNNSVPVPENDVEVVADDVDVKNDVVNFSTSVPESDAEVTTAVVDDKNNVANISAPVTKKYPPNAFDEEKIFSASLPNDENLKNFFDRAKKLGIDKRLDKNEIADFFLKANFSLGSVSDKEISDACTEYENSKRENNAPGRYSEVQKEMKSDQQILNEAF